MYRNPGHAEIAQKEMRKAICEKLRPRFLSLIVEFGSLRVSKRRVRSRVSWQCCYSFLRAKRLCEGPVKSFFAKKRSTSIGLHSSLSRFSNAKYTHCLVELLSPNLLDLTRFARHRRVFRTLREGRSFSRPSNHLECLVVAVVESLLINVQNRTFSTKFSGNPKSRISDNNNN